MDIMHVQKTSPMAAAICISGKYLFVSAVLLFVVYYYVSIVSTQLGILQFIEQGCFSTISILVGAFHAFHAPRIISSVGRARA